MDHSERVAELSTLVAAGIGFKPEQVERVRVAKLVRGVDKIGIPSWFCVSRENLMITSSRLCVRTRRFATKC